MAVPPRTIASGSVTPGRSRWTISHTSVQPSSLSTVISVCGQRKSVPAEDERHEGDERTDGQDTRELRLVHERLEGVGQAVDGLEDRAFRGAHGAA